MASSPFSAKQSDCAESNKKPSERQGGKEVEIAMRKLIERIEKSGMDKEAALAKEVSCPKQSGLADAFGPMELIFVEVHKMIF